MTIRRCLTHILCALCVILAACDTPTAADPVLWEGALVPEPAALEMEGRVAMVAATNITQVGIGVTDGPSDSTLRWVLRGGRCSSSGEPIAPASTFPDLTTSETGSGDAEAIIQRRINVSAEYAAEVFTAVTTAVRVACADLERVQ